MTKAKHPLKSEIKRWAKETFGDPCKVYDQYCYNCISWDATNKFIAVIDVVAEDTTK